MSGQELEQATVPERGAFQDLPTLGLGVARHADTSEIEALGGLGVLAARLYLLIAPCIMLGALLGTDLPANVVFVMPAIGVLLIAPRKLLERLPVSPALLLLMLWIALSYLWSVEPSQTLFAVREDLAPVVGLLIVVGLVPVSESIRWLVRGLKLMVAVSLIIVILLPETRTSVFDGEPVSAWEAWFVSKNNLGRSALVAFVFFLILDKTRVSRLLGIVGALVLVIGASSATALAGVIFATGFYLWALQFRRVGSDWTATYVFASLTGGIAGLIAVFTSAAWVVGVLGRDLSFSGRSRLWEPSLDFISREPWLGYGYRALFSGPSPETLDLWREMGFQASHSHNGPLEVTLGIGVIGLALFFVVYLATLTSALRYLKKYDVAVFAFAFLMLQLMVSFVEPVFLRDWLSVLVICRILLLKMRIEEKTDRDALMLRVRGRSAMTLDDYSALESTTRRGRRGV